MRFNKVLIPLLFIFIASINLASQKSLTLDFGLLYSEVHTVVERVNPVPPLRNDKPYLSYRIGLNYSIPVFANSSVKVKTGINFMRYGTRDYSQSASLEKDLRTSFLVLPVGLEYSIKDNMYIDLLYNLNYSVRRNQTILAVRAGELPIEESYIYNNFSHGLEIGVGVILKEKINLSFRYTRSVSKLWDSKQFYDIEQARWYGYLSGLSLSVGIYVSEDKITSAN